MKLAEITRMARSADPKHPSVRNALVGSAVAAAIGLGYDLLINDSIDLVDSASVGVAAFLGWAIARELDPDRPGTGLLALAGSGALAIWLLPLLLLSTVALAATRLMVGTVGGSPTRLDLVVLVGLAAYGGWFLAGWVLVAMLVGGILVSGGRENVLWAVGAVAAAIVTASVSDAAPHPGDESFRLLVLPLLAVVVVMALPTLPSSLTDIGKQPLAPRRLRGARFLAALAVVGSVLADDVYGLTDLGPLTGAIVAATLTTVYVWLRET